MRRPRYDVCAAVVSDLAFDARVWKEARSLAQAGYRVALIGCRYDLPAPAWRRDGDIDVFEVSLGTRKGVSILGRIRTLLRLSFEILRTRARSYHAHNIHVGPAALLASRLTRLHQKSCRASNIALGQFQARQKDLAKNEAVNHALKLSRQLETQLPMLLCRL